MSFLDMFVIIAIICVVFMFVSGLVYFFNCIRNNQKSNDYRNDTKHIL